MAMQDALLDFALEDAVVPSAPLATSSTHRISAARVMAPNQGIDATSRAVSFAMGFALASVLAWIITLPTGDTTHEVQRAVAATKVESVAPAVEPVVTLATPPAPVAVSAPVAASALVHTPAPAITRASLPVKPAALPVKPAAPRRPVAAGYNGALVLSSAPDGAQVLINGRAVGETPLILEDLPAGSRAVVMRRDGYASWSASVRVVAGQRVTVRGTMTPLDQ